MKKKSIAGTLATLKLTRNYKQMYASKLEDLEEMDKSLFTCNLPKLNYKDVVIGILIVTASNLSDWFT